MELRHLVLTGGLLCGMIFGDESVNADVVQAAPAPRFTWRTRTADVTGDCNTIDSRARPQRCRAFRRPKSPPARCRIVEADRRRARGALESRTARPLPRNPRERPSLPLSCCACR